MYPLPKGSFDVVFRPWLGLRRADNADQHGASTPDDDPRITRVGGLLRKVKFDALPVLNVQPDIRDYALVVPLIEGEVLRGGPEALLGEYTNGPRCSGA